MNSFEFSLSNDARPDPLSDALEYLNLRGWIPGRFELTCPWAIEVETRLGWFYLVVENQCLLEVAGQAKPVSAAAGDLVIVGQGLSHRLRDQADSRVTSIQALLGPRHFERREPLVYGGGGAATRVFCGCLLFEGLERSPLRSALPPVIHIRGQEQHALPYVDHILSLLDLEAANKEPCAQAIVNRLLRILFLKAVQGCLSEQNRAGTNWLGALADPCIGRAIRLMHAQPEAGWTVGLLAKDVAMARSTFSARFVELVGRPPLEYLTDWRMQKACCLLRTARFELKEVAAQVGYESAAAFSKAFTRWVGVAPGAYRRAWGAGESSALSQMPPI